MQCEHILWSFSSSPPTSKMRRVERNVISIKARKGWYASVCHGRMSVTHWFSSALSVSPSLHSSAREGKVEFSVQSVYCTADM